MSITKNPARKCAVCGKRCSKYNEVGGEGATGVHYCERPGCPEAFRANVSEYMKARKAI